MLHTYSISVHPINKQSNKRTHHIANICMSHIMIANKLNEYILNASWTCRASRLAFLRVFRNNNELPVRAPLLRLVRVSGKRSRYRKFRNHVRCAIKKVFHLYKKSFLAGIQKGKLCLYILIEST